MIRLHYHPGNASMAPHIALQELGVPFERVFVDREAQAHKSAAYLRMNPNGLIPVLEDGDIVLYETVAILMHLADRHPAAGLAPPALGSAERAHFYKWMAWMGSSLMPAMSRYFYPERLVAPGNAAGAAELKSISQARAGEMLAQLDAQLAGHGQPWLLGAQLSVADALAFVLCRWTRGFTGPAAPPARDWPHLGPYLQRWLARPALQRVLAVEALPEPWV